MDEKTQHFLRGWFIFIAVGFFIFAIYILTDSLNIENFQNGILTDILSINLTLVLILFISGYVSFKIGKAWSNVFHSFTKILISLAILFITVGFFLFAVNNNSHEIVVSVQPSLDYLVVSSLDNILFENVQPFYNNLNVIIDDNEIIKKIFAYNITNKDSKIIGEIFKEDMSSLENEIFSKYFITTLHNQLILNEPQSLEIPVPISTLKELFQSQLDEEILEKIDINRLPNLYKPNNDAFLYVTIIGDIKDINLNPSKLSANDIEVIWKELALNEDISFETKKIIVYLLLNNIGNDLKKQEKKITISTSSLSNSVPDDFKLFINYDLLSPNVSKRINGLQGLRDYCDFNKQKKSDLCENIALTKYENIIANMEKLTTNVSKTNINETPLYSSFSTIDKLEEYIENKSKFGILFIFIGFILISLSLLTYYLHFKIFNKELVPIHIPYYISKINLINFTLFFVFFIFINFLFENTSFLELITKSAPFKFDFKNLPIYQIILSINHNFIYYSIIYLVISVVLYVMLRYLLKKKINLLYS